MVCGRNNRVETILDGSCVELGFLGGCSHSDLPVPIRPLTNKLEHEGASEGQAAFETCRWMGENAHLARFINAMP